MGRDGTGRPKGRKKWPKTELHPGVNYSRGYIPSVGGRAADEYSVESGKVRSLRKWPQDAVFALGTLLLFGFAAWFVWPHVSDFWELIGAVAIVGKYFVLAVGPLLLVGVVVYYYVGVGTEWPVRTASRLAMIASIIGIVAFAVVLAVGHSEGRLHEYRALWWVVAGLMAIAVVGYLGQRDPSADSRQSRGPNSAKY